MSEWLTKATEALRGEKEPEPQPFEIDCECGTHHGGFRRRKHQRIICRSCGTALFIMPSDTYPPPLAPEPKKKRKRKGRRSARRHEVVPTQAAVDAGRALASKAVSEVTQASAQVAARTSDAGRGLWQRITGLALSVVRFWSPFRIVILCIVLAVGGTVFLTVRTGADEAALSRLKESDEQAREALADGDLAAAQEQFAVAVDALDQLGWVTKPLACEIRQFHRETTAMQDLLTASPFDVAADAEDAFVHGRLDEFDRQFQLHHAHRWIVLEGPVARVGRTARGGYYRIDVPSAIGDKRRTLVISGRLPALDTLKFRDAPRDVILAGQLKSCELSGDRRSWVLRLEPQTAFLWSDPGNYAAIGMASSDPEQVEAVNRILTTQSLANGLER
jgi:hypothetical protein